MGLCLDLDVSSYGKNQKEAEKMLQEAIELTLEDTSPKDYRFPQIKNPQLVETEVVVHA